ncbi:hypothetical protein Ddye_003560 [Dipteronia dyeriana]|uniref:EF-hand domain-containing protein n=1 Tax=Dipteronia dyeriana TaxID=168575 RepID=A0AAD9XT45_9ROSI|nr:hypothetical protein Ddye_003560 [Dipteronia dyeriana]
MVNAKLFGPAATKILPAQINLAAIPAPLANTMAAASPPQMGVATPVPSQNFSFRGPGVLPNVASCCEHIPHSTWVQQVIVQSSLSFASSGISVGAGNSTPDNSQTPWPKMKPSDVQNYSKVFMEVDMDRDERINREQMRNLFTSWRLPRGFKRRQLMGAQSLSHAAGLRPPSPASTPNADGATMYNQQRSTAPAMGDFFANQLDNGEQNCLNKRVYLTLKKDFF